MTSLVLIAYSLDTWAWRTWEWMSAHPFAATLIIGVMALVFGIVIGPSIGAGFWVGALLGGILGVGMCSGIANFGIGGAGGPGPDVSQAGQAAISRVEIKYADNGTLHVTINRQGPDRRPVTQHWHAVNVDERVGQVKGLMGRNQKSIPVRWIGVPQALRQTVVEAFYAAGIVVSDLETQTVSSEPSP